VRGFYPSPRRRGEKVPEGRLRGALVPLATHFRDAILRIAPLFPRVRVLPGMQSIRISLGLLAATAAAAMLCCKPPETRSVSPAQFAAIAPPETFSRTESAGLFVGVREFAHDGTLTVPYAVDDAVDLAYRFSLDQRVGLVAPRRVVLALSGEPQKKESKERLAELKEAGARIVHDATEGDILNLLKEQSARTGKNGLLVLSLATHGFQQNGDAYILGSTSAFGVTETSLRIATLLDIAARTPRSLIFVDACRDRIGQGSRRVTPDPAAAAPHLRKMAHMRGQVIFYAAAPGEYAFDDHVHQNGVFTKAVLDGLNCEASAPRCTVLVETLHRYVDREVRRWIRDNRNQAVNPATQVSMEGETRNMPLARCCRPAGPRLRVSVDGSVITAYGGDTHPMWRKDFHQPILHAETADLDADAFYEVVIGLRDRIVVLDRNGEPLWNRNGGAMTLRTFTTGDLFEKKMDSVVAVWNGGSSAASLLTVLAGDGREQSAFESPEELQYVAIGRPTKMHAPKIIAASPTSLLVLKPRRLKNGAPLWHQLLRSPGDTIRDLTILDADNDTRSDIRVKTANGTTWFNFDGAILRQSAGTLWNKLPTRRHAAKSKAGSR
jgi:hypothetical protein